MCGGAKKRHTLSGSLLKIGKDAKEIQAAAMTCRPRRLPACRFSLNRNNHTPAQNPGQDRGAASQRVL